MHRAIIIPFGLLYCAVGLNFYLLESPCQKGSCQHGACVENGSTGYTCHCDIGYGGKKCDRKIQDCKAALDFNVTSSDGIYLAVLPGDVTPTHLSCDMVTDGGGWTVMLNRANADVDFVHLIDSDYALGFGNIRQNFWLGLENMHKLTSDGRRYQLRVQLQLNSSQNQSPTYYQLYDDFSIDNRKAFNLHVGLSRGTAGDSLSAHNGFGFSTIVPITNDYDSNPTSCSNFMQGNWWFHNCADSCLTCAYMNPGITNCRAMAVIDGFDTLDELEKLPVNEKHRPEREVRIRSVTIHANPMAEKDFKPDR